jgi:hypothetical protein
MAIVDKSSDLLVHYLQSLHKAQDEYLDEYDEKIKAMSKKLVDELITKL